MYSPLHFKMTRELVSKVVSRRRVGQRRLRLGDGTHTSLVGHVLKSDRSKNIRI